MIGCEGGEADLPTFAATVGQTGRLESRKLHNLVRKVAAGGFASPGANAAKLCVPVSRIPLIY
jgi:hypothetical protein